MSFNPTHNWKNQGRGSYPPYRVPFHNKNLSFIPVNHNWNTQDKPKAMQSKIYNKYKIAKKFKFSKNTNSK